MYSAGRGRGRFSYLDTEHRWTNVLHIVSFNVSDLSDSSKRRARLNKDPSLVSVQVRRQTNSILCRRFILLSEKVNYLDSL